MRSVDLWVSKQARQGQEKRGDHLEVLRDRDRLPHLARLLHAVAVPADGLGHRIQEVVGLLGQEADLVRNDAPKVRERRAGVASRG